MGLKTEGVIAGAKAAVVAGLAAAVPTVSSQPDNIPFLFNLWFKKNPKLIDLHVQTIKLVEAVNFYFDNFVFCGH